MVELVCEGAVARLTLNRPEVRNALNDALIALLTEQLEVLSRDPAIRVIVLTGAGKAFCAGADAAWMQRMAGYTEAQNIADAQQAEKLFRTLYECPKITIAQVNGAAMGGGAGLIAACDVAVASSEAMFGFTEVRLGLIPAMISPYVVRKIGMGNARLLCTTGMLFNADAAMRYGLVHAVGTPEFPAEKLVELMVKDALSAGPESVASVKQLLSAVEGQTLDEAALYTTRAIAAARASAEGQEGLHAFLEKQKPSWVITNDH